MKRTCDFFGKLDKRVQDTNSLLCVGLDPHQQDLKDDQSGKNAFEFCKKIVDATASVAAAFKPNAAFFERLGPDGVKALKDLISYIPNHIPVLLDVKRGDISSTAAAYASAAFDILGADAVTVSPYMGVDSVDPFNNKKGRGVFILCKTSNKSSNDLQSLKIQGGLSVFEHVARLSETKWGKNVGLVVGATDVNALRRVRAVAPKIWILAPGVGAQGGDLEGVLKSGLRREDASGVLITVSRGISRADSPRFAAENLAKMISDFRTNMLASSEKKVDDDKTSSLASYQREFIDTAMRLEVLRFGSFTLKSGRISPYFFNAGLFRTGAAMNVLCRSYASAIQRAGVSFDVLFGPAYKGIPLVAGLSMVLSEQTGQDIPFAYNRKEAKDHGEGGVLVGADMKGKRVLIVDDVITAGTAIREALATLTKAGARPVAVALAMDRQEIVGNGCDKSAVEVLSSEQGLDVVNVIALRDLFEYAKRDDRMKDHFKSIKAYRAKYGSKSSQ
jgi:uridine monophosphate synthetase